MFLKNSLVLLIALLVFSAAAQTQDPVKVIASFPKGQIESMTQARTFVVTFNKSMVPLQQLPEGDGSGPLSIAPAVKGRYRWLGVSTLSFTPSAPLEAATQYKIRIPAGVRSTDGAILPREVSWSFTTVRPLLIASFPGHGQKWVELNTTLFLRFNLPMDLSKAGSFIQVREAKRDGAAVPFSVGRASQQELSRSRIYWPDSANVLALRLSRPLVKGKRYFVLISKGIPANRGSQGSPTESSFAFGTYGDMRLEGPGDLVGFPPDGSLTLRFSNPLQVKELAKHLTFTPEYSISEYADYDWTSDVPTLSVRLKPETRYVLLFDKELKDQFGQRLGKDVSFTVTTKGYEPAFNMTTGHGILESYGERTYPVHIVNVPSLDVQMLRLTRETIVPVLSSDTIFYRDSHFRGAFFDVSKEWYPNITHNRPGIYGLKLDEALNANHRGCMLLQLSQGMTSPYHRADIQVTELGITGKFSPDDVLIWVTRLKDASSVASAAVELRDDANRVLWKGTTNADGFAEAPGWGNLGVRPRDEWSRPRLWVIVTKDDDLAYTSSDWREGIEPYRFGVNYEWNPEFEPWQGTIFTDRGIYRPGEMVSLKGVFRRRSKSDWSIRGAEILVRVYDSRNDLVMFDSLRLSEFGSLSSRVSLPENGSLGYYRIEAIVREKIGTDRTERVIAGASFRVEAYRVSEFEVTSRFAQKNLVVGDSVSGSFSAKYLFGGVMKGEKIRWRLRYEPSPFHPEGWEGYWFGQNVWDGDDAAQQSKTIITKEASLDAKGSLDVVFTTQDGNIRSSGNLLLEGDVTSPSRQVASGRSTAFVHGGEFYIGIQPSTTFIGKDSLLTVRFITVMPDGKVSANQKIEYIIVKRQWNSVRKLVGGSYRWQTEVLDSAVASEVIESGAAPTLATFSPKQSGYYVIKANGKDPRGNEVRSDAYFYASGSDYVAWERADDDRIELIADKREYMPGETARIIVKHPYEEATALVTIEREGILRHWRAILKGSAPEVTIPLTKQSLPNVFVSVVLLQGRMSKASEIEQEKDVGRPSFKIGYMQLNVDPGTRHLSVTALSGKQQYRPGDTVDVAVTARDAAGKPIAAEVTMSVADQGVLNLIGYQLPDPFDSFYGPRPLAVSTTESRAQIVLARSFGEKGEDEGGGGGADLGGVEARGNFKYTAYWHPTLRSDSTGMLSVRFRLPDNLTTFKIMCVAQSKSSEFGYGEHSFTVAKPLLLQASLPRFARIGDSFEAGVTVHNYSDRAGTISLSTSGKGIVFRGKASVEFPLNAGESREILQHVEARNAGTATFTFKARMENETDGLTVSIPVHIPRAKETVAHSEAVADSFTSKLVVPAKVFEGLGSIEFSASSTALSGIENSVRFLFDYPYGCIEQRVSRVLPIILAKEMVEAFGLEILKGKDAALSVKKALDELRSFQVWSGGFSYWPGDGRDAPYASAFAMYALAQARRNGYSVNNEMFDGGIEYIKNVLRYEEKMPNYPYSPNAWSGTKTLILYTLAMVKKPEPAYYERYFKNLDRIPLFARANLLKAVSLSTRNKKMMDAISENLLNNAKVSAVSAHFEEPNTDGLEWCWHSNTRTTAIVLQALLETDGFGRTPDFPAKIVRWLMQQKREGRWTNTQENISVVDALSTFYKKHESEEPNFRAEVAVAGKVLLSKMFAGRNSRMEKEERELDAFEKGKLLPVRMKKEGPGVLYSNIRMSYYPQGDVFARDEGIAVLKQLEPLRPNVHRSSSSRTFAPGSLVRVTLRVISPQQRNFVVIDDPLPAGLEAVNTSLATESTELTRILSDIRSRDDEYRWWGSFNHSEFRDDRVLLFADELTAGVHTFTYLARATTYGKFEMPSTYTEMMYEPEVFGRTSSGVIEVK